jgi:hypothetical protein
MNLHEIKFSGGRISQHLAPEDISEGNIHDATFTPNPYHLAAFDEHGNLKTGEPIDENDTVRKIDLSNFLSEITDIIWDCGLYEIE